MASCHGLFTCIHEVFSKHASPIAWANLPFIPYLMTVILLNGSMWGVPPSKKIVDMIEYLYSNLCKFLYFWRWDFLRRNLVVSGVFASLGCFILILIFRFLEWMNQKKYGTSSVNLLNNIRKIHPNRQKNELWRVWDWASLYSSMNVQEIRVILFLQSFYLFSG